MPCRPRPNVIRQAAMFTRSGRMIGSQLVAWPETRRSRRGFVRWALAAITAIVVTATIGAHSAKAQTFTSSSTPYVSSSATNTATAVFSLITGASTPEFQVLITNTTTVSAKYTNGDLLSGFFFQVAGSPILTPVSATAAFEDTVTKNGNSYSAVQTCSNCNENGNWGFAYSQSGFNESTSSGTGCVPFNTTAQYGVATSGFGCLRSGSSSTTSPFGKAKGFGSAAFSPGGQGGNLNNAIASTTMLNAPTVTGTYSAFVTYVFALPATYDVSTFKISNVSFAYGTNPDGTSAASAPEPFSLGIFSCGLIATLLVRHRRRTHLRDSTVCG